MKKIILLLSCATLLFAGCAKVNNETIVPDGKKHVVLRATVNEADTRVSADASGVFSWQEGDKIVAFTNDGGTIWLEATGSGSTASFEGEMNPDVDFGEYAFYPAAEGFSPSSDDDITFILGKTYDYDSDATNMPMMGPITSDGVSFKAVGGVLKLIVYNVPTSADQFRFSSAGDTHKKIRGEFTVSDGSIITEAATGDEEDIVVFNLPTENRPTNMVFHIPLPTGNIGAFTVAFYNG